MMKIEGRHAEALAAYLCSIRPDWIRSATYDALRQAALIDPNLEKLSRVAIRAALTASIRSPSVIGMRGPHWKAQADYEPEPPQHGGRCPQCRGLHGAASPCDPPPAETAPRSAQWIRQQMRKEPAES